MIRALCRHLLLSFRLNFRSSQPLIYGYLVPVFFLLAFGSVFRAGSPPLLGQMGQILTITVLGGACFGMPTAMVNERERGVWRRYRLLPVGSGALIVSAMIGRYLLVLSSAVLQIALAWCVYRTPLPADPGECMIAFAVSCFAFLGLGLIIAMLADTVPAVQALGQAIFLPMILIGGVGVPLRSLPAWGQTAAGFFPGHYSVECLQACIAPGGGGLASVRFGLSALCVIGVAGCVGGAGLFRWNGGEHFRFTRRRVLALLLAVATCLGVGAVAAFEQNPRQTSAIAGRQTRGWESIRDSDFAQLKYDDLPPDEGYILPVAHDLGVLDADRRTRLDHFREQLSAWQPGRVGAPVQRVRNLLSICSVADLIEDPDEGEIAYLTFEEIQNQFRPDDLRKMLCWLVLHPAEGTTINHADDFGFDGEPPEDQVRERVGSYARKLLLRLVNREGPGSERHAPG